MSKQRATFYHAGCPVCVTAEQGLASALNPALYDVETVHLGTDPERIVEAESIGVVSVPALVLPTGVFHINHGANLSELKR